MRLIDSPSPQGSHSALESLGIQKEKTICLYQAAKQFSVRVFHMHFLLRHLGRRIARRRYD